MAEPRRAPTQIAETYVLETTPAEDNRGWVGELLRQNWIPGVEFVQWNVVQSVAGTLRGMHWHEEHHDLIAPVAGTVVVGLADIRRGSPTEGKTELLELDAFAPAAVVIPPGVAHGFYSRGPSTLLYAVSRYWDTDDEFGVAFDDPQLAIPWPCSPADVILSARDRELPPLGSTALPAYGPPVLVS